VAVGVFPRPSHLDLATASTVMMVSLRAMMAFSRPSHLDLATASTVMMVFPRPSHLDLALVPTTPTERIRIVAVGKMAGPIIKAHSSDRMPSEYDLLA